MMINQSWVKNYDNILDTSKIAVKQFMITYQMLINDSDSSFWLIIIVIIIDVDF